MEQAKTAGVPALNDASGIREVADLARKGTGFEIVSQATEGLGDGLPKNVPLLIDHRPAGNVAGLKSIIEQYRTEPQRRKGTASVTTLQSFIDLCNRHKDADSAIFANTAWPTPALVGIMDYHKIEGAPRWGTHRVSYPFPVTEELKVWIESNGKMMEQAEFASFLENHAAELASPTAGEADIYERLFKEKMATPAELISLSRNLEVHMGAKVKRAERLSSGERTVEFVEEHLNAKGEKVDIPGIFIVSVPAFLDGEPVRIPARLRYRVAGGSIHWAFQLYRWEFWLRERVKNDLIVAGKDTGLPTFEGTPEN